MNSEKSKPKKLLLIGQPGAGKTTIHSIIFANKPARDTFRIDKNENQFKVLGNLKICLWDISNCDRFLEDIFPSSSQGRDIFSNVEVLVFVCNSEKEDYLFVQEMNDFHRTVKSLSKFSPDSSVFVLFHKSDKVKDTQKKQVFEHKHQEIVKQSEGLNIIIRNVFQTSICDDTLIGAWSKIAESQIQSIQLIREILRPFCKKCGCDEIVLFEKSTFLFLESQQINEKQDAQKYERISKVIRQFKLSCQLKQANVNNMVIKSEQFSIYIDEFTETTFIMLMYTDPSIYPAALAHNVAHVRKMFDSIKCPDFEQLMSFFGKN